MLPLARSRTVTTVGLPARKEQLIRSMLLAVGERTTDRWAFADDGLEADVAICDVESTLATVAAARERRDGRPHCVWLATEGSAAPHGPRLEDPIGSSSLIALLDAASHHLAPRDAAAPAIIAVTTPGPASLAAVARLRDFLHDMTQGPARFTSGGVELRRVPATRAVRLSHPLTADTLARLLDAADTPVVEVIADADVTAAAAHEASALEVAWRAGLTAVDALLPPFADDAPVRLTRWPDFGRLAPTPLHLQLAARLTRRAHRVDELAEAVQAPAADVRAFVNACALCGLVAAAPAAAASDPPPAASQAARSTYGGILRSIRAALGLGGR
jgi:hypothetical protein